MQIDALKRKIIDKYAVMKRKSWQMFLSEIYENVCDLTTYNF